MGPRLLSRGNPGQYAFDVAQVLGASMGPRLLSRGNGDRRGFIPGFSGASMGPRLLSRGNSDANLRGANLSDALQWGHGC